MTSGVVRGFEPVHVDIGNHELSADALDAIDLARDGSQAGSAAAYSCQLVGLGILTVLGGLGAIFRCDPAVVAALCAIVRCNLAVVDSSDAAVCCISSLAIAGRAIPRGSVAITRRVVARFGPSVTQPGRDITVPRSQAGLATEHRRQLVGPGILAVFGGVGAIFSCDFAVVDGLRAAVRSLGAPGVGPGTFVGRRLAVAGRAIPCGSVAITGRVVTRFSLLVAQPCRDVTVPRSQPRLPAAHRGQLVGLGILAVLRRPCAIVRSNPAVVDSSYPAVRGISAPRVGLDAFVCRPTASARRPIPCGAVELTCRVVARFGISVTLLGGEVARPRSQPQGFAILRSLCAIFGCKPAVVDSLGAVIRGLSTPRGGLSTFVCSALPIPRRAITCGSVEITRGGVARFGLTVTQPGRYIAVLSRQPGLPAARASQLVGAGIFAVLGRLRTILGRHPAVVDRLGAVVRSTGAPRCGLNTFVCRLLTVGGRAIPRGPVEVARRVITRFRLFVAQPGRGVTVLSRQAGFPATHSCQLVGPGILAVLGGLGAIFRRHLAVLDGLGAVVRGLRLPGGDSRAFARRPPTRRGITRIGRSVTLLGFPVAHVRSQVAVAAFEVALACRCQGVVAFIRPAVAVIWECQSARLTRQRARIALQCRPIAVTIAATLRPNPKLALRGGKAEVRPVGPPSSGRAP